MNPLLDFMVHHNDVVLVAAVISAVLLLVAGCLIGEAHHSGGKGIYQDRQY